MSAAPAPWWRGSRGEWYVIGQVILIAVVFLAPRSLPGLPAWAADVSRVALAAGSALMLAGAGLLLAGLLRLGPNLTPLPHPRPDATFVSTGAYRLVRHPMYAGGVLLAFGWALAVRGWLTLAYAAVLLVFLDVKSRREERWLLEKFPGYASYRRHVRKLVPFIY